MYIFTNPELNWFDLLEVPKIPDINQSDGLLCGYADDIHGSHTKTQYTLSTNKQKVYECIWYVWLNLLHTYLLLYDFEFANQVALRQQCLSNHGDPVP